MEDLRRTMFCQCLFQGVDAAVCIHAVEKPPSAHLATEPVHDCHKIEKATPHRDVRDIHVADLIRTVDRYILQKIGPYGYLRDVPLVACDGCIAALMACLVVAQP